MAEQQSRLEDYIDVAERITRFFEKHPEGSLQTHSWELKEVGERLFVVYCAFAYRTPDDYKPGQGWAWEPVPGPTPFTRDSELMNAETAAWGRAIVALGIVASRKIASQQEVKARNGGGREYGQPPEPSPEAALVSGASDRQRKQIHVLLKELNMKRDDLAPIVGAWGVELGEGWMDRLTPGREGTASLLIGLLKERQEAAAK